MSQAQQDARRRLIEGPRGSAGGPFPAMLRSPELTDRLQLVGEYLRWGSRLPADLREIAILVAVRRWEQPLEWHHHRRAAAAAGVTDEQVRAIADGRTPDGTPAQRAVHALCVEVLDRHGLSDASYRQGIDAVGEEGLIDLLGVCGYYVTLAMILNVARTPLVEGALPFDV